MNYVYVRWQPDHSGPEVAFSRGAGQVLEFKSMNEASGPPTHPQMWSAPVLAKTDPKDGAHLFYLDWAQKESERAHTEDEVEPALHSENGPDSRDAT